MTRLIPKYVLPALAVPLVALAVAGCGSGGGNSSSTTASAVGGKATVNLAKTGLGNVLVDAQGHTLYLFKKDAGGKSACFGACANEWAPVRATGKPSVGSGLSASLAMTTARSDGKPEVTYNGHPLYTFDGDQKPGDTSGQGLDDFGGAWYAVSANGSQVTGGASTSHTSEGDGS
jgi:predicted lipoprotein with Yx(FWY)xxD motif